MGGFPFNGNRIKQSCTFICLSWPWSSSGRTPVLFPPEHSHQLYHTVPVWKKCMLGKHTKQKKRRCWLQLCTEAVCVVFFMKVCRNQKAVRVHHCGISRRTGYIIMSAELWEIKREHVGLTRDSPSSLPCWNCSSNRGLILLFFLRLSNFFCTFFDLFLFRMSSSSGVCRRKQDVTGHAHVV